MCTQRYDGTFLRIFAEMYEAKYRTQFEKLGTWYVRDRMTSSNLSCLAW